MGAAVGIFILLLVVANFVGQFVLGSHLNKTRKQSSTWWLWVLFLGWIGVIIIACQSSSNKVLSANGQHVVYVQVQPDGNMVPVQVVPAPPENTVY